MDEGDIWISGCDQKSDGYLKLEADEGDIEVEKIRMDELDIITDEGEIVLEDVQARKVWLATDEGDIVATFEPLKDGNYRLETDEGHIEMVIPEDVNLVVKLVTNEGWIQSDFDLTIRDRDDGEIREGEIGHHGGNLKAYTDEGDIVLKKQ